ncbi:MAG TPA: NAD(P)H-dependent oxidoreductase subunit E [Acidimicrobiales bacterium]|nr:NAD(P)H-dependent oxidoreductase subunit E [Acidimicrobiales bacterium]
MARAKETIGLYPEARSALIPLCHLAQEQDGWLTPEAIEHIAELLGLTPAEVLGTASFYDMLHTEPVGRYLVSVCTNIACLLAGAEDLLEHAERSLGVSVGGTTGDGLFTLEDAECLAACDVAPCLQVNHRFFGPLDGPAFDRLVDDLGAGRLDDTVPRHGVLSRVRRDGGLRVPADEVRSQRAADDAARAARREAAQAAAEGEAKR